MKNVQIPQELFMKLLRYHLLNDDSCTEDVKKGLEQKMNTMVERELYTKSKTALTEEEREKGKKYLYKLSFNGRSLQLRDVSITDWLPGNDEGLIGNIM